MNETYKTEEEFEEARQDALEHIASAAAEMGGMTHGLIERRNKILEASFYDHEE